MEGIPIPFHPYNNFKYVFTILQLVDRRVYGKSIEYFRLSGQTTQDDGLTPEQRRERDAKVLKRRRHQQQWEGTILVMVQGFGGKNRRK
ncbi:hypothetical protein WN943_008299 [Citrus x changshan-huyou]